LNKGLLATNHRTANLDKLIICALIRFLQVPEYFSPFQNIADPRRSPPLSCLLMRPIVLASVTTKNPSKSSGTLHVRRSVRTGQKRVPELSSDFEDLQAQAALERARASALLEATKLHVPLPLNTLSGSKDEEDMSSGNLSQSGLTPGSRPEDAPLQRVDEELQGFGPLPKPPTISANVQIEEEAMAQFKSLTIHTKLKRAPTGQYIIDPEPDADPKQSCMVEDAVSDDDDRPIGQLLLKQGSSSLVNLGRALAEDDDDDVPLANRRSKSSMEFYQGSGGPGYYCNPIAAGSGTMSPSMLGGMSGGFASPYPQPSFSGSVADLSASASRLFYPPPHPSAQMPMQSMVCPVTVLPVPFYPMMMPQISSPPPLQFCMPNSAAPPSDEDRLPLVCLIDKLKAKSMEDMRRLMGKKGPAHGPGGGQNLASKADWGPPGGMSSCLMSPYEQWRPTVDGVGPPMPSAPLNHHMLPPSHPFGLHPFAQSSPHLSAFPQYSPPYAANSLPPPASSLPVHQAPLVELNQSAESSFGQIASPYAKYVQKPTIEELYYGHGVKPAAQGNAVASSPMYPAPSSLGASSSGLLLECLAGRPLPDLETLRPEVDLDEQRALLTSSISGF
jgi:hypothetical protein